MNTIISNSCRSSTRIIRAAAFLTCAIAVLIAPQAIAAPGDAIVTVPLFVPGQGVSVANDCQGEIYYTHATATLYKTDASGADLGSVPILDAAGAPVAIDEMAWDESRQILWGQVHGVAPVSVYMVNATTGLATFAFSATNSVGVGTYKDGIAYDASDDSLWISTDISTTVEHYSTAGTFINQITPVMGDGQSTISGIMVGVGDLLYLGRNGQIEIVQVQKSDGAFISSFASPAGTRDEGLECDAVSFAPTLALWTREFNPPGDITAIEIEPGSCECGGGAVVSCTLGFWKNHPEDWESFDIDGLPAWGDGLTYMEIFNTSPKKGDASVMLAHAYIAAALNTGADPGDLADAVALLTTYPVGSGDLNAGKNAHPDRAVALAVMEDLQDFNETDVCSL